MLRTYLRSTAKIFLFCFSWALIFSFYYFWFIYLKEIRELGPSTVFRAPFAFSFIVIEWTVLAIALTVLNFKGRWFALLRFILVFCVAEIQLTQFYSLYYSSDFMEAGVMAHAALALLMVNFFTVMTLIVLLGGACVTYLIFDRRMQRFRLNTWAYPVAILLMLCVMTLEMVGNKHITIIQESKMSYRAGMDSGIVAFVKMIFGFQREMDAKREDVVLDANDLKQAALLGVHVDPTAGLPFKHKTARKDGTLSAITSKPNVIVFFIESLSADLVGVYQKRWQDVTPNINRFADKSLIIDQYHNHVTPTIVGLRGQLCSNYPSISHTVWAHAKFKLESGNMLCLPHVLNERGYQTSYLGYAQRNETFFADQMQEMGFHEAFFYDDFLKRFGLGDAPGLGLKGNSDEQMLHGLIAYLKEQESSAKKPFFVGVSTVETHPGMNVSDDAYAYKGADSAVLNVVHNFDRVFGQFLDYFMQSSLAQNTIVILTADHSMTPSAELRDVASERYQDDVFNETTFILYDPLRHASGRKVVATTSVDFAPTVLELLSIDEVEIPFMGTSLFAKERPESSSGIAFQGRMFVVHKDGRRELKRFSLKDCEPGHRSSELDEICGKFRLLRYSQNITEDGRFWQKAEAK